MKIVSINVYFFILFDLLMMMSKLMLDIASNHTVI
jgi:hypothetical protein